MTPESMLSDIERVQEASGLTQRLDASRFTWRHARLYGITISGQFFDGFDATMLGVILPGIAATFGLSKLAAGTLASSAFFGMFIGAVISGFIADRIGRRAALMLSISEFSVFSFAAAFAPSYHWLITARALQGIGLGAEVAIMFAYLAEFLPIYRRGVYLASSSLLYQVAGVTSALVALMLVPIFSWRIMFAVGALPLVTVLLMALYLPESVRFLLQNNWAAEARAIVDGLSSVSAGAMEPPRHAAVVAKARHVSVWKILEGRLLKITLGIWFMNLTSGFVFFAVLTWLPSILISEGFSFAHSLHYTAAIALAGAFGAVSVGVSMEAIGRRRTIALFFFCGGSFLVLWGRQHSDLGVLVFGLLAAFFSFGVAGALNSYTGEVYPTAFRARGTGWAGGCLRIGGIIAPPVVGGMLGGGYGAAAVFALLGTICLVSSIIAIFMTYETAGKSLEEIASRVSE
jgi:putative MFS transporter